MTTIPLLSYVAIIWSIMFLVCFHGNNNNNNDRSSHNQHFDVTAFPLLSSSSFLSKPPTTRIGGRNDNVVVMSTTSNRIKSSSVKITNNNNQNHDSLEDLSSSSSSLPSSSSSSSSSTTTTTESLANKRRQFLLRSSLVTFGYTMSLFPQPSQAAADCFNDCLKNCKKIAPNDPDYCNNNCIDYCNQDDRRDGLSGSVSADGGEVGILGGTFGQGTVPKGDDKPPSIRIPGLDFTSNEGKKLLGY